MSTSPSKSRPTTPEILVMVELGTGYCAIHDWNGGSLTPCVWCAKEKRAEEMAKHVPKLTSVICQHCGEHLLRYWGKHDPYSCANCSPTDKHLANLAEFMKELES